MGNTQENRDGAYNWIISTLHSHKIWYNGSVRALTRLFLEIRGGKKVISGELGVQNQDHTAPKLDLIDQSA
jgi:hypothetical protein